MLETYKKGQGVPTRRVAFFGLAALVIWGGLGFSNWLLRFAWFQRPLTGGTNPRDAFVLPVLRQPLNWSFVVSWVLVIAALLAIRSLLNREKTAELLIETDAELGKVNWPSWKDASNSAVVVMIFVAFFTAFLFGSDFILNRLVSALLTAGTGNS